MVSIHSAPLPDTTNTGEKEDTKEEKMLVIQKRDRENRMVRFSENSFTLLHTLLILYLVTYEPTQGMNTHSKKPVPENLMKGIACKEEEDLLHRATLSCLSLTI